MVFQSNGDNWAERKSIDMAKSTVPFKLITAEQVIGAGKQPMPHTVRLFYLTEELEQKACEIGRLIEEQTPITDSSCAYSMHVIIPRVELLTFK